ncbi:hypothetical protein QLS71_001270 [Mariniflexile litorale]|uniref:Uncharacterized protein n=1 Tax=Mariniflexile litorale TaxID=3045158 RepID=A0AAU7EHR4_9FLAO|nr:hypothetical protein [Mariniflexile sp. KMM 9835]MDQ8210904.1 hypothetical protein [Mariniflexile sp. KMM 9835]
MDCKNEITYAKPYYKLVRIVWIETIDTYFKFINWVAGEFDLFLQDDSDGLKIYYPSGRLNIKSIDNKLQITIMSKSKLVCEKINIQLHSIYNQIDQNL